MPLLYSDALSPPERLPVPSLDPTAIISIIAEYYRFLTRLPHISPSWLHFPPESGWSSIDEETLRQRGRSDRAIQLLKHLPYFQKPAESPDLPLTHRAVRLSPDYMSIAYHSGQVWQKDLDEKCPTPGNVIWLTDMDHWDGTELLLDVEASMFTSIDPRSTSSAHTSYSGTITELSLQSHGTQPFPRENPSPDERWMACPTWSIDLYFTQARRYYERLIWIPRPPKWGDDWSITVRTGRQVMDALMESDEDFDISRLDEDYSDSLSTQEDEQQEADDDGQLFDNEVDELMEDAGPDGTYSTSENTGRVMSRPVNRPPISPEPDPKTVREEQSWSELIAIYINNSWPHEDFDKENCISELGKWRDMENNRATNAFYGR